MNGFLGILGVLCLVFWYFVAANTPNDSKIMSSKEKDFLNYQLQDVNVNKKVSNAFASKS